jgi:hypothetical protein
MARKAKLAPCIFQNRWKIRNTSGRRANVNFSFATVGAPLAGRRKSHGKQEDPRHDAAATTTRRSFPTFLFAGILLDGSNDHQLDPQLDPQQRSLSASIILRR